MVDTTFEINGHEISLDKVQAYYGLLDKALRYYGVWPTDKHAVIQSIQAGNEQTLQNVPIQFKGDKDIVMAAVTKNGSELKYASSEMKDDIDIVMAALANRGSALQYASDRLKGDREVVLAAVSKQGGSLRYASDDLKGDKDVLLTAVSNQGAALQYASDESHLKADRDLVLKAVGEWGDALQYASSDLKADQEVVLMALNNSGLKRINEMKKDSKFSQGLEEGGMLRSWYSRAGALQYASDEFKADKSIVLAAVKENGYQLQYASPQLRADKEVVLAAASNHPDALKYAQGGLNQDRDCWVAAGFWVESYDVERNAPGMKRIVLSTKFSLSPTLNPSSATNGFTALLNKRPYFRDGNFTFFAPNAFNKQTCDPEWTRIEWPCRGTIDTCQKELPYKTGAPSDQSCWRYAFRWQLEEAKRTGGFMIQVVQHRNPGDYTGFYGHELGKGQEIETVMANQVGTKIFRIYEPENRGGFVETHLQPLEDCIFEWYRNNCEGTDATEVGRPERLKKQPSMCPWVERRLCHRLSFGFIVSVITCLLIVKIHGGEGDLQDYAAFVAFYVVLVMLWRKFVIAEEMVDTIMEQDRSGPNPLEVEWADESMERLLPEDQVISPGAHMLLELTSLLSQAKPPGATASRNSNSRRGGRLGS